MTLTAAAGVAIKWFVKEQGFEEARGLLAHRIHLHAPDILLAEFANTIWKKVHRRENRGRATVLRRTGQPPRSRHA